MENDLARVVPPVKPEYFHITGLRMRSLVEHSVHSHFSGTMLEGGMKGKSLGHKSKIFQQNIILHANS